MTNTVSLLFRLADGSEQTVHAEQGQSVMEAAIKANVPGIEAECGGACMCATCHVYADPRTGGPNDEEAGMLEDVAAERRDNSRLSCQIRVEPGIEGFAFTIPERQF